MATGKSDPDIDATLTTDDPNVLVSILREPHFLNPINPKQQLLEIATP